VEEHRARAGHLPEGGGGSDRWGLPIGGRGKRGAYPFGVSPGWASGQFWGWADLVPPACFLFLYFLFLLFYILISDLIQTFANLFQINSNKFLNSSNVQQSILKH
jgi:hypothetical protein